MLLVSEQMFILRSRIDDIKKEIESNNKKQSICTNKLKKLKEERDNINTKLKLMKVCGVVDVIADAPIIEIPSIIIDGKINKELKIKKESIKKKMVIVINKKKEIRENNINLKFELERLKQELKEL